MRYAHYLLLLIALTFAACSGSERQQTLNGSVVDKTNLETYVTFFNNMEDEHVKNLVPNAEAYDWLAGNIPLFECPDSILEQTYYYRWWTFRKHLKSTPDGFVFTEFITPVGHDGKYNTISCALGHHIYEGRWLHDPQYIDQYIKFWYLIERKEPESKFHKFSSWAPYAIYDRMKVTGDTAFALALLDELDDDYNQWIEERRLENGMFWQFDVRDGMEESISGSRVHQNARPTINSYMYGNSRAISRLAEMAGNDSLKRVYDQRAAELRALVHENLWDEEAAFFKSQHEEKALSDAREAIGYIPWYFNLPEDSPTYGKAWLQIRKDDGFAAPWGLTTAERRHPEFRHDNYGSCEWDGPIWPFATTQTLKGLGNLIRNYENHDMTRKDYFSALKRYAVSHQKNGKPFIGEYQHETTGRWLKGDNPRSRYYNHSGFCDLIISELVGLRPREDNVLEINPLIPEDQWEWFALDSVKYHDHIITIVWDKTGEKYNLGKGFMAFSDGEKIAEAETLTRIEGRLKN